MADEAPQTPAPEGESVADKPTNTNTEPAQAPEQNALNPDLQGFSIDELKEMRKFFDNSGGFEKVKSRLSNPEPKQETSAQTPPEAPQAPQPPEQPQAPTSPQQPPQTPAGAVTQEELLTKMYFEQLSKNDAYKAISEEIADGSLLKEMSALGIEIRNPDGSFNDTKINTYLGIKAQTVPATPSSADTEQSPAPTVDYVEVGDEIKSMDEARTVLMQAGHPKRALAEKYLSGLLNKKPEGLDKKEQ